MDNEKICVTIKGKTYDNINDVDLTVTKGSIPDGCDKGTLIRAILDRIGEKIAKNDFFIGSSKNTVGNNLKLYSEFGGGFYYGGIAGVLRTPVTVSLPETSDSSDVTVMKLDVKLQITTKFDNSDKPYFLATMLLYDKLTLSKNMVPSNEEEIFDYLLLFRFKEQLQQACLKGLFRTYRRFERNDEKLRGAIDIARHIKLNAGQNNGKIAYSYRENTTNNFLNYLIVAAYTHLKEKYYDLVVENIDSNFDLLSVINQLKNDTGFIKGGLRNIISKNLRAITHPLYTEYEELRITSIRILRDEGLSIFDGEDDDTEGILFYVPDLWESFLENAMDKYLDCLRKNTVKLKSQEILYALSRPGSQTNTNSIRNFFFETRPDYVFYNVDTPIMVLDAKFRPAWEDSIRNHNSISSLLDDFTKCLRDMCDFGVHHSGVIFPFCVGKNDDALFSSGNIEQRIEQIIKHSISCYNTTDAFYTIPIRVPLSENVSSYSDWRSEFDKCLAEDIKTLNTIISKTD